MSKQTKKSPKKSAPECVFCHRSSGVQFAIFTPRFEPFGTACVECERTLPEGTKLPAAEQAPEVRS